MNYITIEKLEDLNQLLEVDIYLTGKEKNQEEELRYNTWEISFTYDLMKNLTLITLKEFITDLIKRRAEQVAELGIEGGATFYMWFNEMSCQLCFDVLSGRNIELPFRCSIELVNSCEPILKEFLKIIKRAADRGSHIGFEDIVILEPGDEGFGEIEEEKDPKSVILDVYVTHIP